MVQSIVWLIKPCVCSLEVYQGNCFLLMVLCSQRNIFRAPKFSFFCFEHVVSMCLRLCYIVTLMPITRPPFLKCLSRYPHCPTPAPYFLLASPKPPDDLQYIRHSCITFLAIAGLPLSRQVQYHANAALIMSSRLEIVWEFFTA